MGFKDLALFNDALLAKQAWRLLHNKDSLFHRVFKSKFLPDCSFMEALECASGSYAWSSLLKGREVLWRGAHWRVGNGDSIKIWDHPWLPSLEHPRVLSPVIDGLHEATVNFLIKPTSRSWDRDTVAGFFAPLEADLILKIPLSATNVEDKLIWPHVPNGVYSVKSGYRFLVREKAIPRPSHQAQAQPPASTLLPRPQRETPKWEPPPSLSLKINFDGAVFRDKGEAGLGMVVCDSHGRVIASLVEKIQLPSSSDEVEALAAVQAITLAMDLNLPSFIVEGDSKVVISALRKEEESFSSFGHLIFSAKYYLHLCNCISFSHIRRSGNSVAHALAK
ncbi:hypothetical protein SO802_001177 [Lithocarpus litseifolius]|uniref:RNase H type-1 domain-containing protein n=1 Tax=Lithocarpus litseifolius TaxID=425828 RepID=A0AAW2DX14_9ROSI